jgi:outer membrane protein OmpA-like peptidoglycan-associated protein
MNGNLPAGRRPVAMTRLAAAAAMMLLLAARATAEDAGPRLEISLGPSETGQLTLIAVRAELDGRQLPLEKPDPKSRPGQPIYAGPLPAGQHQLKMTVTMAGDNVVFRYVTDYRFDMSGTLEFASAQEGTVQATATVKDRLTPSAEWYDRYALALSAVRKVPLPAPGPEEDEIEVVPPPQQAALAAPCSLAPLHFKLADATLSARDRVALDQFAACLTGTRQTVRLVGHCDARGSDTENQRLGKKRAGAAARYLEARGLSAARIGVESRGAVEPLCAERTDACHARNRRVDAVVGGP